MVRKLLNTSGIHDIFDDGTDIVVFRTRENVKVMIHLFERLMSLVELRQLFEENSASGIHTLPLFWADMLLPGHGQLYEPDEWMMAMLKLQNSWIYGYEVFGIRSIYLEQNSRNMVGYMKSIMGVHWTFVTLKLFKSNVKCLPWQEFGIPPISVKRVVVKKQINDCKLICFT